MTKTRRPGQDILDLFIYSLKYIFGGGYASNAVWVKAD
jgi:hypothetical protein